MEVLIDIYGRSIIKVFDEVKSVETNLINMEKDATFVEEGVKQINKNTSTYAIVGIQMSNTKHILESQMSNACEGANIGQCMQTTIDEINKQSCNPISRKDLPILPLPYVREEARC